MTHIDTIRPPNRERADSAPAIADTIADLTRLLNRTVCYPGGLTNPGDAYRITGALMETAMRLPQSTDAISRYLTRQAARGTLRIDNGSNAVAHTARVADAIRTANQHARLLEQALAEAFSLTGAIGYHAEHDDSQHGEAR
ncbi:hypothetical protein OG216_27395 [Streptomycetaceae bacterium NBC_01309]